jgi:hypothetical protein
MYKPKSREEYISQCRYYDGTEQEWTGQEGMFAFYECCWVDMHYPDAKELREILSDYKLHKLGHFNDGDGVPITLKALLWSRYCHWSGYPNDDENFKVFYREEYLKTSSK